MIRVATGAPLSMRPRNARGPRGPFRPQAELRAADRAADVIFARRFGMLSKTGPCVSAVNRGGKETTLKYRPSLLKVKVGVAIPEG